MNQTVTINISGIVFHIELDAYEDLKNYLNKIKSYFKNSEECEDIMSDIEARIAELFSEKMSDLNQVILRKDVDEVITIMGKPEQYIDEDSEEQHEAPRAEKRTNSTEKKFFRNPDERVLGGVASGIASYFGFDTIWARLFFVLTTLFVGFGPLLYIILWIVIPEAKTASDRLQMKGDPINIDNIGKTVQDEAGKVNEKLKNVNGSKIGHILERIFNGIIAVIKTIFKAAGKLIGAICLLFGLLFAVWFIMGLVDDSVIFSYTSEGITGIESSELFELMFATADQFYLFLICLIVVIVIPIIGLMFAGVKLLFGVKGNGAITISLSILWFIGLFAAITLGLKTASDQKSSQKEISSTYLSSTTDVIYLKASEKTIPGEVMLELDDFSLALDEKYLYSNEIELTIKESQTDSVEMIIETRSNGKNRKKALENVRSINYDFEVADSLIKFDEFLTTPRAQRMRNQSIRITLKLPLGKAVYLDESLNGLIYDIDNVTDTWDRKMIGEKWVMLPNGLTCLDCSEIDGIKTEDITAKIEKEKDELESAENE